MEKIEDIMIFIKTRPCLTVFLNEWSSEAWVLSSKPISSEAKDVRNMLLILMKNIDTGNLEIIASMPIRGVEPDWYLCWKLDEKIKINYTVGRKKMGRPKRQLTSHEKDKILAMRAEGLSINAIAKEMRVNNKLIMKFCRILLVLNKDDNALEIGRRLYEEVKPGKKLKEVCTELHIDVEPAKKFLEKYNFWLRNKEHFKKLRERFKE